MHTPLSLIVVSLLFCATTTQAQDHHSTDPTPADIFAIGFGYGQDYGGLGLNLTVYPQKNIGVFGGFGYALAGFGYNAGIKLRLLPNQGASMFRPFVEAMYGYNAAVYITNYTQYNKLFYGPTIGAGVDIGSLRTKHGYFSAAILVPIRNQDAQNYMDGLQTMGVQFNNNLLPISLSFGYKFIVN
jgi:hypothetical protein